MRNQTSKEGASKSSASKLRNSAADKAAKEPGNTGAKGEELSSQGQRDEASRRRKT